MHWELSSVQVAELTHLNSVTLPFLCLSSGTGDNEWQKWPGTTKETDWKGWGNPQLKQLKTGPDSVTSCSLSSSTPGYWAEQPHKQMAFLQPPDRSFANSFLLCFCKDISLKLLLWPSQMRLGCCRHPCKDNMNVLRRGDKIGYWGWVWSTYVVCLHETHYCV